MLVSDGDLLVISVIFLVHFLVVLSCSVVFSVSSLALCPAMQAVCGVLIEQDFVSRWAPCVAIVSRAWYHTWRGGSLSGAGPVNRRCVAHASMQTSLTAFALPHRSTRLRRPLSSRSMAKTPQPAHRRHGPRCRGARASSTSTADDEPAAALEWRKTHVPLEVKDWLDWSLASVSPLHNQSAARHLHGRSC